MSGDSAGGNLVAAMHIYMIQHNIPQFMASHLLLVYVGNIIFSFPPSTFSAPPCFYPRTFQPCVSSSAAQISRLHGFMHRNDSQPYPLSLRPYAALRNRVHVSLRVSRRQRGPERLQPSHITRGRFRRHTLEVPVYVTGGGPGNSWWRVRGRQFINKRAHTLCF